MRKSGVLSAIVLAAVADAYGQGVKDALWSNPVRVSSRAQVIASLEHTRVKLGDPIKLHFRLKNVSSEAINVVWGGFNENYWLMVIDASGRELPLTKEGERLRQPSKVEIHSISGALGPREQMTATTLSMWPSTISWTGQEAI